MKAIWRSLVLLILLSLSFTEARAQDSVPPGPIYVVQEGDNFWSIALFFGLTVEELASYNSISDPGLIKPGDRLVIPNLEDIQGEVRIAAAPLGETVRSLSRRYQVAEQVLLRLNHLANPDMMYAGMNLALLDTAPSTQLTRRSQMAEGESLLEMAVLMDTDPWLLVDANSLAGRWDGVVGDILFAPGEGVDGPGALPAAITALVIDPLPLVQGKTAVIRLSGSAGSSPGGSLAGHVLGFFQEDPQSYVALQGIHAMQEPGLVTVFLSGTLLDGSRFEFSQPVSVAEGGYVFDPPLYVDPSTINPEVTRPEDAEWTALAAPLTPEKSWSGIFTNPVAPEFSECWPSRFGSRRSYNDSPYDFFHTGLDFCGAVGNDVFAPAPGLVVFAGQLSVRGNATMIDHGWGVYSGYMHQSELLVQAGDRVEAGQLIGKVGATGRVTGAHLHWEMWVGGVQVEPLDWLKRAYP